MIEIIRDPIELTKPYLDIVSELEEKIEEELKNECQGLGFCHIYWNVKKKILKNDYGIKWKSPSELNPHILYD